MNAAISRKAVEEKRVLIEILHIGLEEKYKFVFAHVKKLFSPSGGLYL